MNENEDQKKIREVIATWMKATSAGDVETVLGLMAEDVVFLVAGQPPMRGREAYAAATREVLKKVRIDGVSEIQEVEVDGDHGY